MAAFDIYGMNDKGPQAMADADVLFRLGLMYVQGRDCETDMVAAHKWLNIAAIKGSSQAAQARAPVASNMSKIEIARALREARAWMTMH